MAVTKKLLQVITPVRRFLHNEMSAAELVTIVDDLVADNLLSQINPDQAKLVDRLQVALSLYAPDEMTRREEPAMLIGDMELRERVSEFNEAMKRMGF